MELSPVQRFAAFAVVVLVLAGLGAYLFLPRSQAADRAPGASHPQSASPAPAGGSPSATPSAGVPDIYQWLPFTSAALANASTATTAFAQHYGTFSYTESTQAYLAPMRPLITPEFAAVIGRAFAAPGLAGTRHSYKQVAKATAAILALRAFGPSSLTFVVAIAQRITSTKGTSKQTTDYAVTLTGTGSNWQVNDIELAAAGNL